VCPFESAKQSHTSLGSWVDFKSLGKYDTMWFNNGNRCWNGPARSLKVRIRVCSVACACGSVCVFSHAYALPSFTVCGRVLLALRIARVAR
jgi:Glucosidase II beta subunit-like protein